MGRFVLGNYLKWLFLMAVLMDCESPKSNDAKIGIENDSFTKDTTYRLRIDTSYNYYEFIREITQPYIDSLNNFKRGDKLPAFLVDVDLDLKSEINKWANSNFVSLREEIFRKVDNVELLNKIVQTPYFKYQFQDVEKRRAKIPSDEVSNYVLAQERLNELSER